MDSKSLHVKTLIMLALERGEFKVGDKLPTETKLAKKYGCSRTTIREGLTSLTHAGIFEKRRGAGTFFVTPVPHKPKSKIIGAIVPSVSILRQPSVYHEIIQGIEDAAHKKGYSLIIGNSGNSPKKAKLYVSRFLENNVGGIIYSPMIVPDCHECNVDIVENIERKDVPFVIVNSLIGESMCRFSFVGSNHFSAMVEVVKHLVSSGHKRIGFVRCFIGVWSADQHLAGFLHQLRNEKLSVPDDYIKIVEHGNTEDIIKTQGRKEIKQLLSLKTPPTAVICTNDYAAKNIIFEVEQMGLHVPDDLAVVGFDDRTFAPYLNPPLTTVRQQFYEEGRQAFGLLEQKMNNKLSGNHQQFLDCELIVRKSCGTVQKQASGKCAISEIANDSISQPNTSLGVVRV